ncbi:hypothetical protein NFI96_004766 [Prochilodus magdalenae]|nr:hypothetical protein NFI96_004766 [Prochilodus magdalenae]
MVHPVRTVALLSQGSELFGALLESQNFHHSGFEIVMAIGAKDTEIQGERPELQKSVWRSIFKCGFSPISENRISPPDYHKPVLGWPVGHSLIGTERTGFIRKFRPTRSHPTQTPLGALSQPFPPHPRSRLGLGAPVTREREKEDERKRERTFSDRLEYNYTVHTLVSRVLLDMAKVLLQPLDYEIKNLFSLRIEATNRNIDPQFLTFGPFSDITAIRIKVEDVNEPPVFPDPVRRMTVSEAATVGTDIGSVSAHDPDSAKRLIRYSIDRNTDLERYFNVNATSGVISTAKLLDREVNSVHNITIIAMENIPADGAVGVEVEGHQVFWTCDYKPSILVLTTVPPHTDSLGVSTKTKAGLVTEDDPLPF